MNYIPKLAKRTAKQRRNILWASLYFLSWSTFLLIYDLILSDILPWILFFGIALFQAYIFFQCGYLHDVSPGILSVGYLILVLVSEPISLLRLLHPLALLYLFLDFTPIIPSVPIAWKLVDLSPNLLYNLAFWLGWFLGQGKQKWEGAEATQEVQTKEESFQDTP